jgi:hypothetical protein
MKRAAVKRDVAPLYGEPDDCEPITDEVLHGMTVDVLDEGENYLYINTPYRYKGWIKKQDVCYNKVSWQKPVTLSGPTVDVLSAPTVRSVIKANLTTGCIVGLVERKEKYSEIVLADGTAGFIMTKYISEPWSFIEDEGTLRSSLIAAAKHYLGMPYRWGGKTPRGIDCSGLCQMAYMRNGITIYRDAKIIEGFPIKPIGRERLGMGDLIFFPGHVAMYIGGGMIIHSSESNGGVYYDSLVEGAANYRADLASTVTAYGSVFE